MCFTNCFRETNSKRTNRRSHRWSSVTHCSHRFRSRICWREQVGKINHCMLNCKLVQKISIANMAELKIGIDLRIYCTMPDQRSSRSSSDFMRHHQCIVFQWHQKFVVCPTNSRNPLFVRVVTNFNKLQEPS